MGFERGMGVDFDTMDPYTAELLEAQRRRNLASAQMAAGMDMSPIRHWSQGAARLAQAIIGRQEASQADAAMREIAQRRESDRMAEVATLRDLVAPEGGQKAGRDQLARTLLGMKNPRFQAMGFQLATAKDPEEEAFTLKPGETRFRGSRQVASLPAEVKPEKPEPVPEAIRLARIANDPNVPDFERQTAAALLDKMKRTSEGGATPYFSPVSTPEGVFAFSHRSGGMAPVTGPDGKPMVRASDDPGTQARLRGAKEYGAGGAKANIEQGEAAQRAAESLAKIDETLNLLKSGSAITGMGADVMLNIERARSQFLNSEKAGKRVSDSQLLDALLGQEVFPMIGALGIGARGLDTPAEREFLRMTMTGTRPMDRDSLIRLTEIRRDIQRRAVDRWNDRVNRGELDDYFAYTGRKRAPIEVPGAAPSAAPAGRGFRVLGRE